MDFGIFKDEVEERDKGTSIINEGCSYRYSVQEITAGLASNMCPMQGQPIFSMASIVSSKDLLRSAFNTE